MKVKMNSLAAICAGLTLSACAGDTPPPASVPTVTATITATATATRTVMPTPPASASASTPTSSGPRGDITEDLLAANKRQPWVAQVISVTEGSPGEVSVETSITDPRGPDGSQEARTAVSVCEAVVAFLRADGAARPKVMVRERDGTTFAYAGQTSGWRCVEY